MTDKKSWHDRETLEAMGDSELEALGNQLCMVADDNLQDIINECSRDYDWATLDFWDDTIATIFEIQARRKGILPVHWNMGDELACDRAIEGDPTETDFQKATCHWCKETYYSIQRGIEETKEGKGQPISTLCDGIDEVE